MGGGGGGGGGVRSELHSFTLFSLSHTGCFGFFVALLPPTSLSKLNLVKPPSSRRGPGTHVTQGKTQEVWTQGGGGGLLVNTLKSCPSLV